MMMMMMMMMMCTSSFGEAHARVFEPHGVQREQRHVRDPDEEVKEKPSCFRTPHLRRRLRRLALEDY
jgi:hypothetical protein